MHSWRVWVLTRGELGAAVFHGFSAKSLFCFVNCLPKRILLLLQPTSTTIHPTVYHDCRS
jgi:hypothetical protein